MGLIPTFDKDVILKLTPEEARREAIGKALGLIGTVIGVTGTLMALSVNPAFKETANAAWAKAPKQIKENTTGALILAGIGGALFLGWLVKNKVAKQSAERYA
jgi:hypothetical protein